jgi:hypothetical protein
LAWRRWQALWESHSAWPRPYYAGRRPKKIFVWHTGFWGKDGLGWNYDLLFVAMNLVILFTAGGRYFRLR